MEILAYSQNIPLIFVSCLIALVAGFTGLSLTRNLAQRSNRQRKASVALGAIALGGGIWSMHFVAMLGLQMPILFYYDAAVTLVSALIAILIVAGALIVLHFGERTTLRLLLAGAILGIGVLTMHYVGMAGLRLCRAVHTVFGVTASSVAGVGLCMLAIWFAYQKRNTRNIFLGTICFATAVACVHFFAMAGTNFVAVPASGDFGPAMSNEFLAIGVVFSSFVIFGACLWVSTTYLSGGAETPMPAPQPVAEPVEVEADNALQIPCERDSLKIFIAPRDVAFIRADGHYTQVYTETDRYFCVWPITEANRRLQDLGFLQTHRSYLVNPAKVERFERSKDKGRCVFFASELPVAPVSRSKLKDIQSSLGESPGATRAS